MPLNHASRGVVALQVNVVLVTHFVGMDAREPAMLLLNVGSMHHLVNSTAL